MSSISKVSYKAGDYIFFEGDLESHFFIIESGAVKILSKNKTGQKIELARLIEGETFGEFAMIDPGPRTASAIADTDTKLLKISEEGFEMMLEELPTWASSMLKSFAVRLKSMNKKQSL